MSQIGQALLCKTSNDLMARLNCLVSRHEFIVVLNHRAGFCSFLHAVYSVFGSMAMRAIAL